MSCFEGKPTFLAKLVALGIFFLKGESQKGIIYRLNEYTETK